MVEFVYLDETEAKFRRGDGTHRLFTLMGVLVDEVHVREISETLEAVCLKHLGYRPTDFEFHGYEIWDGGKYWHTKTPSELIAVFDDLVALLDKFPITLTRATIDKTKFESSYGSKWLKNSYLLALQFLLEKVDDLPYKKLRIVVADNASEHELRAISMTAAMQMYTNSGVVPGRQILTVIDSLHFVNSKHSAGVQLADVYGFLHQRSRHASQGHADLDSAMQRFREMIDFKTKRYRSIWP